MKVKEVIAELQKLDKEREIWISYDGANREDSGYTTRIYVPIPNDQVKQPLAEYCEEVKKLKDIKVGDYLIEVG